MLAVRLPRAFFDEILSVAVASSFDFQRCTSTQLEWQQALASSDVRLPWDPDHDPHGRTLERGAIQLGLRGNMLERFGQEEVMQIMDITEFVKEQSEHVDKDAEQLMTPTEAV